MLCLTTGAASSIYTPAIINDLYHLLWPIHNGMLAHTGSGFPPPFAAWMQAQLSGDECQQYLNSYSHYG